MRVSLAHALIAGAAAGDHDPVSLNNGLGCGQETSAARVALRPLRSLADRFRSLLARALPKNLQAAGVEMEHHFPGANRPRRAPQHCFRGVPRPGGRHSRGAARAAYGLSLRQGNQPNRARHRVTTGQAELLRLTLINFAEKRGAWRPGTPRPSRPRPGPSKGASVSGL
jgi:hypothetical protein